MNLPTTMRALRQGSLAGPRDLRPVADAPVPAPGPGEVLVRVTAAGVNLPGGEAPLTNRDLVYRHPVHVIGLNIGVLIQAAPRIFGEVMGELFALLAAGVVTPGRPTTYELAQGPKALAELEARATVGKLVLRP